MTGCGVFWSHCFDTVEMACPRLGSIPAGYIINEPNAEAVDGAGCCRNNGRAGGTVGFHTKVLCLHFGEKRRTIVAARFSEARAVGRRRSMCAFVTTLSLPGKCSGISR